MLSAIITVVGLVVLEVVQSVDNAIVNAHMLKTMSERARRWFLLWGILTAVFLVRGLLPLVIVWLSTPDISFLAAAQATIGGDASAAEAMEKSAYILLTGGGVFLLLLYFHWLFLEKKDVFFVPDKWIRPSFGVWFFAVASILLVGLLYVMRAHPAAMMAAALGHSVFFIIYGFRETAEKAEQKIRDTGTSDISKLLFLEVLDLSFSIDGVFSAFAFTTNVLLILVGNGIGALVVRDLTIRGVDRVGRYKWLKNGAMTSIGVLGAFMILEAIGVHLPEWLPTVTTLSIVGYAFYASWAELRKS